MAEIDPFTRDELLSVLHEMTPAPLQTETLPEETTRLIGGSPPDVVIDLSPDTLTIAQYAVSVESDRAQVLTPRILGKLNWTRIPEWTTRRILGELVAAAIRIRREEFSECLRCRTLLPPEDLNSSNVCHKCTANEDGVVY